ncbi:MAG: type II toxin-antitoxin system RelE/ParE family toxin [Hyphomonadaceae bacterium]|nr:type II toxin-antitoxin system RelE/ParE family toxin [Hyphomonadaceae bacterium]GIK47477.1 MAG: plasmid stabilization protein ParE [Alphaproteobacteria bacterium]
MTTHRNLVLSEQADADIDAILLWTAEHFGARQAETYLQRIDSTLQALAHEPLPAASRIRDQDLGRSYRTLHLGRRSRHMICYRVEEHRVFILRILHDSMDLAQHLPDET